MGFYGCHVMYAPESILGYFPISFEFKVLVRAEACFLFCLGDMLHAVMQ